MGGDAIPAGMKRWDGGDVAPADWDSSATPNAMWRDGSLRTHKLPNWRHGNGFMDIVAYTPKPDAKPDDGDRDAAVVEAMTRAIGEHYDGYVDPVDTPFCWQSAAIAARAALAAYRAHQEVF